MAGAEDFGFVVYGGEFADSADDAAVAVLVAAVGGGVGDYSGAIFADGGFFAVVVGMGLVAPFVFDVLAGDGLV